MESELIQKRQKKLVTESVVVNSLTFVLLLN